MYEDPKSKISQLEKLLDAREDLVTKKIKRHELHDRDNNIRQNWDHQESSFQNDSLEPAEDQSFSSSKNKIKNLFSSKLLIGSIVFFIIALVVVMFNFIGGGNLVSGNNIEVTVKAPISVAGGEKVPFEIEIKNNNNVTLLGADMGISFPLGAKEVLDTSVSAKRVQEFLGDIKPGQIVKKNLSVILFGVENEKKDINITLEYKVAGSNSSFNKVKIVTILISSSPVSIVVSNPNEVNTNQSIDFNVEITSNSTSVIKDLLLKVDYPFGFSFKTSSPKNFSKDNLWLIGDLEPGAKRVIKISGILTGQEGEERGFNFNIGSQSKADNQTIDVPFSSSFSSIVIRRPFVSADIFFNGVDTQEYISTAGENIDTVIRWRNNLSYEVSDVSIIVKMSGNTVDKSSIQVSDGYYKSIDNTINFNKTTDPALAILEPGQVGESNFSFSSFGVNSVTGAALINPTIVIDLLVSGKRVDYISGQEDVLFSDSRKVKVTSNPQLFAKALYYIGSFQNKGPIPPVAEKETTYTITWTIINPLNNISNTQVTAVLPPYVKWLSNFSPSRENINYDESTGKITWSVGNVSSGAGTVTPAKEVSFQVSLLPSVDQIATSPKLIGEAVLSAKDSFTLTTVFDSFVDLTTKLNNDPYFRNGGEIVIQ